jgi:predicted metal-dependent hydrolase
MTSMPHAASRLQLPYGDRRISCEVRRSYLRTKRSVAIHVEPDGRVLVDAPSDATAAAIRLAVCKRLAWIHRRLVAAETRRKFSAPREYVSGETILYLGRRYQLKVVSVTDGNRVRLRGRYLEVRTSNRSPDTVRALQDHWFRERARELLPHRLALTTQSLHWLKAVPEVSIRQMRRQWGSCSPAGRITLNTSLIHVPGECIDYVLLHELCHLKAHNHGRAFYRLLDRHLPRWKQIKTRLDDMADRVLTSATEP